MANTFSSLHYHIVFATKERVPFLRALGGVAIQVGGIEDHIHMLARLKPTHFLPEVLRKIKKASSDWAASQVRHFRWQDGYAAFTVGRRELDRIEHYIVNQEEHHRQTTFEDEYRELLRLHEIDFDERYLL
jgi:putative transposase